MTDPFSVPSAGGATMDDLVGRLLLLTEITIRANVPNPFNPGHFRDEADAVITVLDGEGDRPKGGIFGARLVRQCKARAGLGWAYGRLVKVTVQGREALELADPGPADTASVREWLTRFAPHYLNGGPAPAPAGPPAGRGGPPATPHEPYGAPAAHGGGWGGPPPAGPPQGRTTAYGPSPPF